MHEARLVAEAFYVSHCHIGKTVQVDIVYLLLLRD